MAKAAKEGVKPQRWNDKLGGEFEGSGDQASQYTGLPTPEWFYNMSDQECQAVQQLAISTGEQRQRVNVAAKSYRKVYSDRTEMVRTVQDLMRYTLGQVLEWRQEQAKTAKANAQFAADVEVLGHETRGQIDVINHEKTRRVGLSSVEANAGKQLIDFKYTSLAQKVVYDLGMKRQAIAARLEAAKNRTPAEAKPWMLQG